MKKAVYAGSFDPITNGHLHIIKKACSMFDEVIVLIANNPEKKYMFSLSERKEICRKSLLEMKIKAGVEACENRLVAEFSHTNLNAQFLIRGIRSVNDFQEEVDIYHTNRRISHDIETVFLMPDIDLSSLRSSVVKGLVGLRDWWWNISDVVPRTVLRSLSEKCASKIWNDTWDDQLSNGLSVYNQIYSSSEYHNWIHVLNCLQLLEDFDGLSESEKKDLTKALLVHDVVDLNLDVGNDSYWSKIGIAKLILATNHDITPESGWSRLENIAHDVDLEVLSWSKDRYNTYTKLVRREYCDLSDSEWRFGRSKFLELMLKRERIYLTDEYFENKEVAAASNMTNELEGMRNEGN